MRYCDGINFAHDNLTTNETEDGIRVVCRECKQVNILRKERETGRFNNRDYSKIFKRDIVQPGSNLYYKYYPSAMNII